MADRVGVIRGGRIVLVEEKATLMRKLGRKELVLTLQEPLARRAADARRLRPFALERRHRTHLCLRQPERAAGISRSWTTSRLPDCALRDVTTRQSTLEDIFVSLVETRA